MRVTAVAAAATLILTWMAPSTPAHHAFTAEFDVNQPIKVRGTITKMEWVNPHSWLYVDVKEKDGRVVNWAFELGAVNGLFRRGWRKDSVKPGTEVVIDGFRAKNGKPVANGRSVRFPDGRELFTGGSAPDTP
jgi:hypothetical protein